MKYFIPDAALVGKGFLVDSVVQGEATNIPAVVTVIVTGGYYLAGDRGNGLYKRVVAEPVHGGKFQSADGAWWELEEQSPNVLQFGADGTTVHDLTAFTNALGYGDSVYVPDGTYIFSDYLTVPASKKLFGPGLITADVGYASSFFILLSSNDCNISDLKFDGTNLPIPIAPWTGAGAGIVRAPVGSAIFVNGTSSVAMLENIGIENITCQNFPSGPICAFYTNNIVTDSCEFFDNQTYLGGETNAIIHYHGCDDSKQSKNYISGFNWKGYYNAASDRVLISNNISFGGSAGMADYYSNQSTHLLFDGNIAIGGFGLKLFRCQFINVNGFQSISPTGGGVYFQATSDVVANNISVFNPGTYGIIVESSDGNGSANNIIVDGFEVNYTTAGTSTNNSGIRIAPGATSSATNIKFANGIIRSAFFGIWIAAQTGGVTDAIDLDNISIIDSVQYSVIGYVKSLRANKLTLNSAYSGNLVEIYSNINVPGTKLDITKIDSIATDVAAKHIDIGQGGADKQCLFETINIANNNGNGGTTLISIANNNGATDNIKLLNVCNNIGYNVSAANAISLTMNATNTCFCSTLTANTLVDNAGNRKNINVANSVKITNKVDSGNNVNAVVYA